MLETAQVFVVCISGVRCYGDEAELRVTTTNQIDFNG